MYASAGLFIESDITLWEDGMACIHDTAFWRYAAGVAFVLVEFSAAMRPRI